jgi:hypothetical protein
MDTNRIPKQALQYKPKGLRNRRYRGRDGETNFILRIKKTGKTLNPLNTELNPICHLLALLAHPIFHVSRIRVNSS